LEQVISDGQVVTAADLQNWLGDILTYGAGRSDALLLVAGLAPDADLQGLDDIACALAPSAERLRETQAQGEAFARTVAAITGRVLPPRTLPSAVADAAQWMAVPPEDIAALYLHAFAANLISVAVRFVPLGQTEGQATLAALHPVILTVADQAARTAAGLAPGDLIGILTSSVLAADLAAMRHETLDVRLYRT
jgi:urease accessory protein